MTLVRVTKNTKASPIGDLLPSDLELMAIIGDLLYAAAHPVPIKPIFAVRIERISYSNPFDVTFSLEGLGFDKIVEAVRYGKEEKQRRQSEAQLTRQKALQKKLENIRDGLDLLKEHRKNPAAQKLILDYLAQVSADEQLEIVVVNTGDIEPPLLR